MLLKIKHLATVQMGYSFRSRLEVSTGGDLTVIQMKDLLPDNTVDLNNLARIDMSSIKEHHMACKGDLVFRSRGQITTSAVILEDPGKSVISAPLLRIRIKDQDAILPEYLNWFISQREAQVFLTSRSKVSVQKMISKEAVEDLEIFTPSIKKQKNIVELASLSAKEQILSQLIADKKQLYIEKLLMNFAKGE